MGDLTILEADELLNALDVEFSIVLTDKNGLEVTLPNFYATYWYMKGIADERGIDLESPQQEKEDE